MTHAKYETPPKLWKCISQEEEEEEEELQSF
jgi:hypothetical protein